MSRSSGTETQRRLLLIIGASVIVVLTQSIMVVRGEGGYWSVIAVAGFLLAGGMSIWQLYRRRRESIT